MSKKVKLTLTIESEISDTILQSMDWDGLSDEELASQLEEDYIDLGYEVLDSFENHGSSKFTVEVVK